MVEQESLSIFLLIVVAVETAGVAAAIHAVMRARTSQGAIAWAISLVTFPWVALPCYAVFGANRFHGYLQVRRAGEVNIRQLASHVASNHLIEARTTIVAQYRPLQALERLAKMPFVDFNQAKLLIDGKATFDAIFSAIAASQHYILIQFFIIKDDSLGRRLKAHLIAARQRGVHVYVLYDAVGSRRLPRDFIKALRATGVEVKAFGGSPNPFRRLQVNFRNHRKVVVVDGQVAFVGGHNVGDEYIGLHPTLSPWRDTHVQVNGPAVLPIQLAFVEDWSWVTGEIPGVEWKTHHAEPPHGPVLVLPTGPADAVESCGLFFVHAIHSAQHRVWITSPYFVPDSSVLSALRLAAMRGVDVRIMLPNKPDHLIVYYASLAFIEETREAGIRLFQYRSGFLHQKVMVVDDVAAIGTANLDNRSFRLNFEITLVFLEQRFAAEVAAMLENDFAACDEIRETDISHLPFVKRVAARTARLFSPVL